MKFVSPFHRGTICQCRWRCPAARAAGDLAEIQSHIEPFGPDRLLEQAGHPCDRLHQFERLLGR